MLQRITEVFKFNLPRISSGNHFTHSNCLDFEIFLSTVRKKSNEKKRVKMYKHYIEQLESFNKKEPPVRRFQPQMQGTELEQLWANLSRGESKSLLKKHLTPERYKLLKDKKTKLGGTLADCIRSGKLYYACASTCISTGKKLGSENNWCSLLTLRRYNKFEKKKTNPYESCLNVRTVACVPFKP